MFFKKKTTKVAKRIFIKQEHIHKVLTLLDDYNSDAPKRSMLKKYQLWSFLGREYPDTISGEWQLNAANIMKPCLDGVIDNNENTRIS